MSNIDCLLDVDPGLLAISINDKLTTIDRFINAGVGLTGGGNLRDSDLTINAITPSTIDLTTVNDASIHTHEITTSSDPANTAAILSTDAAGLLTLLSLDVTWLTASDIQAGTADFTGVVTFASDIYSVPYVSQSTGWKITSTGNADFRDIYAETLSVRTFIADNVLATAGTEILTKSLGILAANFVVAASVNFVVFDLPGTPDVPVFSNGDTVSVRRIDRTVGLIVEDIIGTVSGYVNLAEGKQQWTLSVSSGTIGATVYEGATVLDWGVSGDGFILSTAVGVDPPYIDVRKWATTITNDTTYSRYGYLNGITGQVEYGLYSGISATQQIVASDQRIELRGAALSLYDGATEVVKIDPLTLSIALGNPLPSFGGTGIWFGKHSGLYKARIGSATDYFLWDGSLLTVAGRLFVDDDSEFTGVVTIGASGGIWQGAGTFASPTSGLKIWNDGGVGRFATYNSSTTQVEIDTSGRLLAGGGNVVLDSNGLSFVAETVYSAESNIVWYTGTYEEATISFYVPGYAGGYKYLSIINSYTPNKASEMLISGTAASGYDSNLTITVKENGTLNAADIYMSTDNPDFGESIALIANRTVITGQATLAEGLIVGYVGVTPTSDQIRLYRGSTLMGQLSTNETTYLRINQDVAKNIYTPRMFIAANGLSASPSVNPGFGGVGVGYGGKIVSRRLNEDGAQTNYTGYTYVPLAVPKINGAWDGDTKTSANNISLDLSVIFDVPRDAKAVNVRIAAQGTVAGDFVALGPTSAYYYQLVARCQVAGTYIDQTGVVSCDSNGDIYVHINGTNQVFIQIWGYYI